MREWKVQSLVGVLAAAIYLALSSFLSLPYVIELVMVLAIIIPAASLGRKLLQANGEQK